VAVWGNKDLRRLIFEYLWINKARLYVRSLPPLPYLRGCWEPLLPMLYLPRADDTAMLSHNSRAWIRLYQYNVWERQTDLPRSKYAQEIYRLVCRRW
jgi:hypothetical protein